MYKIHNQTNNMKIYVIGADHSGKASLEMLERIKAENPNLDIVSVSSIEDIPINDRIKLHSTGIYEFKCPPIVTPTLTCAEKFNKKRKGHERPYKYHR